MKNNKIVLSIVVSSLLFSQSYALPSGGKFTHGTSGSISVNGNTMNITGNKVNSVIQWGGGFNIAKGETVNFNGSGKNYLNIAYGSKSSTIDGLLNTTGNNVYLINPNGVVIGKSGTINANKFGVSTSSIDSKAMQEFADNANNPVFSPVFKPNNKGNVINMGNINAKDVLIIGNEVGNIGSNGVGNFNLQDNGKVQFVGDKVKVNVGSIKNAKDIIVSAQTAATLGQSTTDVYKNNTNNLDDKFKVENYSGFSKYLQKNDIDQKTTIANVEDWAYFAKGINENQEAMQSVDTFDLISDIDFGANCNSEGVCTGQNYANFNVAGNSELQNVNMIVGKKDYDHAFHANFNGNGYTLSNINIDTTVNDDLNSLLRVGLFGYILKGTIKDLTVDYKSGGIKSNALKTIEYAGAGGLFGYGDDGTFTNISLNNVSNITSKNYAGGFGGIAHGTFTNISLNNIGDISGSNTGGFGGWADGTFTNISLNNISNITSGGNVGGFGGSAHGTFTNISLNNIGDITGIANVGGFGGSAHGTFTNISLNNIGDITGNNLDNNIAYIGGFGGQASGTFTNISLNNIGNIANNDSGDIMFSYVGGFVGDITVSSGFTNIILNNIGNISGNTNCYDTYVGGFVGEIETFQAIVVTFSNIYIFLNKNTEITSDGKVGLFIADNTDTINKLNNIHIYKYNTDFTDSSKYYYDKDYWYKVDSFNDAGQDGKINIHSYTEQASANENFKNVVLDKLKDIKKDKNGNLIFTTDFTVEAPDINPNANQELVTSETNNKISQDDIDKEVIDSILADTNVDSWINVNDNPTKIQVSQGDINSINQSFDFMEALVDSNFIDFLVKENSQQYTPIASNITNILQAKTNIQALIGNVNNLVNSYNDFQSTKEDLNKAIDAYNAYVALINQGAASSKDAEFISLKNKVNELYAKAQGYLDTYKFDDTLKSYKTQALSQSNNHFSIKGEFDTKLASLDSVLDKPNNEGGDTSNPEVNAPLPFSEALLTQMDESVLKQDEDDKEPTVDEASTQLSGNTCIVSDNFKAGNPCSR
ncbi:beta strand repeat-containing protein [Campylobacter jejuni]